MSAYGESIFLCLQTSFIALLILIFTGRSFFGFLFAAFYSSVFYACWQKGERSLIARWLMESSTLEFPAQA